MRMISLTDECKVPAHPRKQKKKHNCPAKARPIYTVLLARYGKCSLVVQVYSSMALIYQGIEHTVTLPLVVQLVQMLQHRYDM